MACDDLARKCAAEKRADFFKKIVHIKKGRAGEAYCQGQPKALP
jgi:hypothetical protein